MFYSNMEGPAMLGSSTARSENTWGLEMLFPPGGKSLGMVHVFSEARDHVAEHGLQCRLVAFRRTTVLTSPISTNLILARMYSSIRARLQKNIFAHSQLVMSFHILKLRKSLVNRK